MIEKIKEAIAKAERLESKLAEGPLAIGGYTSPKIRHLLNNLGAICTSYLEVGVHRGATFVSTCYGNGLLVTHAIDNFSEFDDGTVYEEFVNNCSSFVNLGWHLYNEDCFTVSLHQGNLYDLYLYDGGHSLEAQQKAVTHFLDSMAPHFIMCVDDANWDDVRNGTNQGLEESGLKVLFDETLVDGYHNGFRVLLLQNPFLMVGDSH